MAKKGKMLGASNKAKLQNLKKKLANTSDPEQYNRIATRIKFLGGKVPDGGPGGAGEETPQPGPGSYPFGNYDMSTAEGLAGAQYGANYHTAQAEAGMNRPNEYNPFGSRNYGYDENGNLVIRDSLDPAQQARLDAENAREMQVHNLGSNLLGQYQQGLQDPSQLYQGLPELGKDFAAQRADLEQSLYQTDLDRMQPEFDREREQFHQTMLNRGHAPGSELYDREMDKLAQRQNDAKQQAYNQARLQAGNEQQRLYGMNMGARQQGIQENLTQRQLPLNEFGAMQGYLQGVQMPQFTAFTPTQIAPTNVGQIGLGFGGFEHERAIQKRGFKQDRRMSNLEHAQALQMQQNSLASAASIAGMNNAAALDRQQLANQGAANVAGSGPSTGQIIGGAVAGGIAGGLGQGIGNYFGG